MSVLRAAVVLAFAAAAALAQKDAAIQIHGRVAEIGLHAALAGAEVTLYEFVGASRARTVYATAATGPRGEFLFHPERFGDYWVEVKKQGYFASVPIDGVYSTKPPTAETGTLITVTAAHPSQEVRFALMRPATSPGA